MGVKNRFPVGQSLNFVLTGGLDYYPSAKLTGHDTAYRPNDENVNPRADYTYTAAVMRFPSRS